MENYLDQLARTDVPPLPADFDRRLHRRLNGRLLLVHLADLGLRGLPWAMGHFLRAVAALVAYSAQGRYPNRHPDDPRAEDRSGGT